MPTKLTPRSDVDLCSTCSWAHIREGYSTGKTVLCTWLHPHLYVRDQTTSCNGYKHKNDADIHEMKQIAWIITSDPKGKIGFRRYKDMEPDERTKINLPGEFD